MDISGPSLLKKWNTGQRSDLLIKGKYQSNLKAPVIPIHTRKTSSLCALSAKKNEGNTQEVLESRRLHSVSTGVSVKKKSDVSSSGKTPARDRPQSNKGNTVSLTKKSSLLQFSGEKTTKPRGHLTAGYALQSSIALKSRFLVQSLTGMNPKTSMLGTSLGLTVKNTNLSLTNSGLSTMLISKSTTSTRLSAGLRQSSVFSCELKNNKSRSLLDAMATSTGKNECDACVQEKAVHSDREKATYSDIELPCYDSIAPNKGKILTEAQEPAFVQPENDPSLLMNASRVEDVQFLKQTLINAVSASLICAPDFKESKDPTRLELCHMADKVAFYDAEFVLKVALYTRNELNIRTTANFLLAFASNSKLCRPYLKKYYCRSIRLPSDWIDVAEQFQAFYDKTVKHGSLPSALRKAMVAKFPEFDVYQLGKYNKESSVKKKQKTAKQQKDTKRKPSLSSSSSSSDSDSDVEKSSDSESEEELERLSFTLKQLIRKLHIAEPVDHVMCLIGKKYPETLEEFYKLRLPGTWEEEKAGKRMKLPTPETWETQVSLKGNKAKTWEDLIDHKKLPYMAMLRNLRNLIQAGISEKHHSWVLKKLCDQGAVINSRQFPFRFFSAYEVLGKLKEDFERNQDMLVNEAMKSAHSDSTSTSGRGRGGGRGRGRGRGRGGGKTDSTNWFMKKKNKNKESQYSPILLDRYRKALDKAVKIATVYNISPIKGRTVIFCDLRPDMCRPCTAARGLGKPRQIIEVAVLLGLMCKHSCEESELIVFGTGGIKSVELEKGTILDNMASVLSLSDILNTQNPSGSKNPMEDKIKQIFRDRLQVDNMVVLSNSSSFDKPIRLYLQKYRFDINPNLLYVSVNLGHTKAGIEKSQSCHPNDIHVTGYSDQILRFIAERGGSAQLTCVENIDQKYNLMSIKVVGLDKEATTPRARPVLEQPLALYSMKPRWRTSRVFISSTFRDMHGERDLLTRFVFPELHSRAKKLYVNVHEVDLRWGVTEEITRTNKTLELCLTEISRCQYFMGLLGERYGWIPDAYTVPDKPEFDWLKDYPAGRSVTELEMQYGALNEESGKKDKAFFYLRDNSCFEKDIPKKWVSSFTCENNDSKKKINALKDRIRTSGYEAFHGYEAYWGGVVEGKPILVGLESFGLMVLSQLWEAIQRDYTEESVMIDENTHLTSIHNAAMEAHQRMFVGRKNLLKQCVDKIGQKVAPVIVLSGGPGSGKSSLVASVVHSYVESSWCQGGLNLLVHFVGAAPGSSNIFASLRRLTLEVIRRFNLATPIPEDFKNMVAKFEEVLKEAGSMCDTPFVVVIDGIDMLDSACQALTMEWLPEEIPENVIILLSVCHDSPSYRACTRRHDVCLVDIGGLDTQDKPVVIRHALAQHRKLLDESPFNNQMKLLMSKKEAGNPLFLSLACEELRVFGVFEKVTEKLKSMPHTIPQMLQAVLMRLENDLGKDLINIALSLVICARNGLDESDLHSLVSLHLLVDKKKCCLDDVINISLLPEQMVPKAKFIQLLRAVENFLQPGVSERSSTIQSVHSHMSQAVRQRYLLGVAGTDRETHAHTLLAGYFLHAADPKRDSTFQGQSLKAFSELPFHLVCSSNWRYLQSCLCNLSFIQRKFMLGLGSQLLEDFASEGKQTRVSQDRNLFLASSTVQDYKQFVSRNMTILSQSPALIWQQAFNDPDTSQPNKDAHDLLDSRVMTSDLHLVQWVNKPDKTNPCILTLDNFPEPVTCVAVSTDGQVLACGTMDCVVKLYNLTTGKELRTLIGHSHSITDVCFVGRNRLCSASKDSTLSLWSMDDGHRIAVMKGHSRVVTSCSADAAGRLVVSTGWDCGIMVWDGTTGQAMKPNILKGEEQPVNCVAFHPEGQLIVTGGWDSSLKIWDILHMIRKGILRGHTSSVRAVAYSASGRHIASAALDGEVKLWSATNGSQVGSITGHLLPINSLTFSQTGLELITVGDDNKIKVWSGHLGQQLKSIGSEEFGAALCVCLSEDGRLVAIGYHDGAFRLFDAESGDLESECTLSATPLHCVKFTKGQDQLVTGYGEGTIHTIDVNTRDTMKLKGHDKAVLALACSQFLIAAGSDDFTVSVHNATSGMWTGRDSITLRGHTGPVTGVSFNSDETKLVTSSRDMSLILWSLSDISSSSQPECVLHACHADWITGCAWSDISDHIVTASNDFNLKLWDVKTKKEKIKLTGHTSSISAVGYKHGCVVSSCNDGSVKVWSHKGTEITTLYGHTQRVNSCDIAVITKDQPDDSLSQTEGQMTDWSVEMDTSEWKAKHDKVKVKVAAKISSVLVATCSDDGTVKIWKPLEANELACLCGHSDRVVAVASCREGHIVSSSLDGTVKQWQPTLESVKEVRGHRAEVTCTLVFSYVKMGGDECVITGSRDGTVMIWNPTEHSCVHSWVAHDRGVNSMVATGNHLVTGSDDATVRLWKVTRPSENKDKIVTRLVKTVQSSSGLPVTRLTIVHHLQQVVLVWTDQPDQVHYTNLFSSQARISSAVVGCSWVTDMCCCPGGKVFCASLDRSLVSCTVETQQKTSLKISADTIQELSELTTSSKPLCLSSFGNFIWVGDSEGTLTVLDILEEGVVKQLKIHSRAITTMVHGNGQSYTGSRDGCIKVWDTNLKQTGQFYTQAPVTSLAVAPSGGLVAGDELGNVYFLVWRN